MAAKANPVVGHQITEITPRKAREMLEANTENRRMRAKVVAAYRRDMELGHWMFTGDPIQVSRTGQLLNGQHRLTALAHAEGVRSLPFLLVTGLPDEVKTMLDQGVARTASDALMLAHGDIKHVTVAAAMARWVRIYPEGPGPHMNPNTIRAKITHAEVLETFNANPDIKRIAPLAVALRDQLPGSPTAIGFSYLFASRIDADQAGVFFNGILNQDYFPGKDPRKALVNRMRNLHLETVRADTKVVVTEEEAKAAEREQRRPRIKQPTTLETGVIMVSAISRSWNAWRKGEEMSSINSYNRLGDLILPVKMT